jgi:hypothetical protein
MTKKAIGFTNRIRGMRGSFLGLSGTPADGIVGKKDGSITFVGIVILPTTCPSHFGIQTLPLKVNLRNWHKKKPFVEGVKRGHSTKLSIRPLKNNLIKIEQTTDLILSAPLRQLAHKTPYFATAKEGA